MHYKTGNSVKAHVTPSCVSTVLMKFPERGAIARDLLYFACLSRPPNIDQCTAKKLSWRSFAFI